MISARLGAFSDAENVGPDLGTFTDMGSGPGLRSKWQGREDDLAEAPDTLSFIVSSCDLEAGRSRCIGLKGFLRTIGGMEHYDRLIDVHELAAYLEVPVKTLYAWRYRREGPPALRVGRHLRYRWSDVHRWIELRIEPPLPEPGSIARRTVGEEGRTTQYEVSVGPHNHRQA